MRKILVALFLAVALAVTVAAPGCSPRAHVVVVRGEEMDFGPYLTAAHARTRAIVWRSRGYNALVYCKGEFSWYVKVWK